MAQDATRAHDPARATAAPRKNWCAGSLDAPCRGRSPPCIRRTVPRRNPPPAGRLNSWVSRPIVGVLNGMIVDRRTPRRSFGRRQVEGDACSGTIYAAGAGRAVVTACPCSAARWRRWASPGISSSSLASSGVARSCGDDLPTRSPGQSCCGASPCVALRGSSIRRRHPRPAGACD